MRMCHAMLHALFGIPDNNIRIRAFQQRALARVETKYFRRVRAGIRHKLVRSDLPRPHSKRPHDWHTILDSWQSIRDFREVIFSEFLTGDGDLASFIDDGPGPVKIEGTMIRTYGLQKASGQPFPQARVILLRSHGWRTDPLGAICTA